jgi:hypothetical protein
MLLHVCIVSEVLLLPVGQSKQVSLKLLNNSTKENTLRWNVIAMTTAPYVSSSVAVIYLGQMD